MGSKTSSDRVLAPKVLFFLLIVFVSWNPVSSATTCAEALEFLTPCGPYAKGAAPFPPSENCCAYVNGLANLVGYRSDAFQAFCKCYRQAAPSAGFKADLTQKVVYDCGYPIGLPTDPKINCDSL
ncbi:hypothetical protein BT93_L0524 [Corymbia citriodora subsp. variegata]|uniref:Bifunctional inhibitor/plant lipid transfer protein/seed storage helical domain-containing protein n=1 Tax=Corymbia citriodora subsp. variegata TaxID=360336 RepID=A0A8T0CX21_CORYI|nr:hypothetical protein BT93_L0524 [Corymbia citriodora subsp. variegata]